MNNIASDNHFLLCLFTSRNPKYVLLKLTPLFGFYFYHMFGSNILNWIHLLVFFLAIFSWSFFEYVVHRWFYHKRIKSKKIRWFTDAAHIHHHTDMSDHRVLNAGVLLVYPFALVFLGLIFMMTRDYSITSSFGLGFTLYYVFYEYIHYQIHNKEHKSGYLKFVQQYHLYHHYKKWNKNYGNTLSFWDKVFGTYDVSYKLLILTNKQRRHLIIS